MVVIGDPAIEIHDLVKVELLKPDRTLSLPSGIYQVRAVTHRIQSGSFETELDLFRAFSKNEEVQTTPKKVQVSNLTEKDFDELFVRGAKIPKTSEPVK